MEKYTVEIDELHDDVVILAVRALRLLVFGRSLEEAMTRARAAIDFRCLEPDRRPNPSLAALLEPADTRRSTTFDGGLTVLSTLVAGHDTTPTPRTAVTRSGSGYPSRSRCRPGRSRLRRASGPGRTSPRRPSATVPHRATPAAPPRSSTSAQCTRLESPCRECARERRPACIEQAQGARNAGALQVGESQPGQQAFPRCAESVPKPCQTRSHDRIRRLPDVP
jgi:hypothetical protein